MENGSKKVVKIQLSPITDDQDIVRRIMFIVEDITEEEKLKEALKVIETQDLMIRDYIIRKTAEDNVNLDDVISDSLFALEHEELADEKKHIESNRIQLDKELQKFKNAAIEFDKNQYTKQAQKCVVFGNENQINSPTTTDTSNASTIKQLPIPATPITKSILQRISSKKFFTP